MKEAPYNIIKGSTRSHKRTSRKNLEHREPSECLHRMFMPLTDRLLKIFVYNLMSIGMLTRHEYQVIVRNTAGSFDFRLFDHIQVCFNLVPRVLWLFGQWVGARRDWRIRKKIIFLIGCSVTACIVLPQVTKFQFPVPQSLSWRSTAGQRA